MVLKGAVWVENRLMIIPRPKLVAWLTSCLSYSSVVLAHIPTVLYSGGQVWFNLGSVKCVHGPPSTCKSVSTCWESNDSRYCLLARGLENLKTNMVITVLVTVPPLCPTATSLTWTEDIIYNYDLIHWLLIQTYRLITAGVTSSSYTISCVTLEGPFGQM